MKVFISWSGEVSRKVALALREWLPSVLNAIDPFMSQEDIHKGMRWNLELAEELESTSFGIVCVTPENIQAPWLNYEAGALSKAVSSSLVAPFLFGLSPSDLTGPLAVFQAVEPSYEDVLRLLTALNSVSDQSVKEDVLRRTSEWGWPQLKKELTRLAAEPLSPTSTPTREAREVVGEVLDVVRDLERTSVDFQRKVELDLDALLLTAGGRRDRKHPTVGDAVQHHEFGRGKVIAVEGLDANSPVVIDFDTAGRRRISPRYAPLLIIDSQAVTEV